MFSRDRQPKSNGNNLQREALEKQLEPILIALNKAIADGNRHLASSNALSLSAMIMKAKQFASSPDVCDEIVQLMRDISAALISINIIARNQALIAVEKWQTDNNAKVILDMVKFNNLVTHRN